MFDIEYSFGKSSTERLKTCHEDLQLIMNYVIKFRDCSILCGHRTKELQNEYFDSGKSKVKYPHSKHNKFPSFAVDVMPYDNGIDWEDIQTIGEFARFVQGIALGRFGIKIRWGGDFNSDWKNNQKFFDAPHFELHSKWDKEIKEFVKYKTCQ
jgi:hypothetical protein